MQSDPIGLDGGINSFTYAENDSISWIDATGLVRFKIRPKKPKGKPTTCPTLPPSRIVNNCCGITVEHFFKGTDHAPAHAHVSGGGNSTRIGANCKPLMGDPELSKAQKQVLKANKSKIRCAINKIGRYLQHCECNK